MDRYWAIYLIVMAIGFVLGACVAAIKSYLQSNYMKSQLGHITHKWYIVLTLALSLATYSLIPELFVEISMSDWKLRILVQIQEAMVLIIMCLAAILSLKVVSNSFIAHLGNSNK